MINIIRRNYIFVSLMGVLFLAGTWGLVSDAHASSNRSNVNAPISIQFVSASASVDSDGADFDITYRITATGTQDIYIPATVARQVPRVWKQSIPEEGAFFGIQNAELQVISNGTTTASLSSTALATSTHYLIENGTSEDFSVEVSFVPPLTGTTTLVRMVVPAVGYRVGDIWENVNYQRIKPPFETPFIPSIIIE